MPEMNPFTWLRRKSKPESEASVSPATTPPPYEGTWEASSSAPTTPTSKRSSLSRPKLISRLSHSIIGEFSPKTPSSTDNKPIRANDVPQWMWSNAQCRTWLAAVLQVYLNWTSQAAETAALKLDGHGPTMYQRTSLEWEQLLGEYNGKGIYVMLLNLRHHPGAVPGNVNLSMRGSRKG
jgi:hypothetical protein